MTLGFQTIGKVRALNGNGNGNGAAAALIEDGSSRLILRCVDGDNAGTARLASSLPGLHSYVQRG